MWAFPLSSVMSPNGHSAIGRCAGHRCGSGPATVGIGDGIDPLPRRSDRLTCAALRAARARLTALAARPILRGTTTGAFEVGHSV